MQYPPASADGSKLYAPWVDHGGVIELPANIVAEDIDKQVEARGTHRDVDVEWLLAVTINANSLKSRTVRDQHWMQLRARRCHLAGFQETLHH